MLPKTGLPSLPFLQHALLTHWSLCGGAGRPWALAATVADIEAFVLGKQPGTDRCFLGPSRSSIPRVCVCVCFPSRFLEKKEHAVLACGDGLPANRPT